MSDTTKTVPIDKATGPQLRAFAEATLGMTFGQFDKVKTIRATIKTAWDKPEITVAADPDSGAQTTDKPKAENEPAGKKKEFIVYIDPTEEAGGDEPVPLGCNGKVILVPRGQWCAVPLAYLDSLRNAVMHRYEPLKEGGMSRPRAVNMYPYRLWNGDGEPAEGVLRPQPKSPEAAAA